NEFVVTDLGLRLDDITGVEREPAARSRMSLPKRREQLINNGATEAEVDILLHERVELNALTSDALVAMIERKLEEHGVTKVVPDDKVLKDTYRAFHRSQQLEKKFKQIHTDFED